MAYVELKEILLFFLRYCEYVFVARCFYFSDFVVCMRYGNFITW